MESNTLPDVIVKWLENSNSHKIESINNVELHQKLQMKIKPKQKKWYSGKAIQHFSINPPFFEWNSKININSLVTVSGRDRFTNGVGEMLIKLFDIFPVVNEKNNSKIDQGTMQRFLAEIVWFPIAATEEYIKWQKIDNFSAEATMDLHGVSVSGTFTFDENSNFKQFKTLRYQGGDKTSKRIPWIVTALNHGEFQGVTVPVELKAEWQLDDELWTWLQLEVTDIKYS
ncbi:hypothetical protein OO013_09725 [Mangrovivirga sp. M17]|uniref:Uncharacterized protein n=1 Tax=Mangrovivirga halotolerans TaxID=2993936 RepID=A0ABT3RSM9_9BACT|nr:DUF6544 family protein [Mangrovivirga halotolerans]MCX2744145.1 hypothetical protein [Mangrovivirga halotolerans]